MGPILPVVSHSTCSVGAYGTSPPTDASTFTVLGGSATFKATPPCNRMFILGFDIFIDAVGVAPPFVVETSVTLTVTRGNDGQWVVFSQAVSPAIVASNQYATASYQFATPIPFINMNGGLSDEVAYDPTSEDGVELYAFVHGAVGGGHEARVVLYWSRMAT